MVVDNTVLVSTLIGYHEAVPLRCGVRQNLSTLRNAEIGLIPELGRPPSPTIEARRAALIGYHKAVSLRFGVRQAPKLGLFKGGRPHK